MDLRKTKGATAAVVGAVALVAAGCGSSSSGSSTSAEGGGQAVKAALLLYTINDYTSVEKEGVEKGLGEVGGEVAQTLSANFNPQEESAQCQDAITSERFNVLIVDPVDSPSAVPCAQQAGAAGLKVIALENPIGPSRTEVEPQLAEVQGSAIIEPLEDAENTFKLVKSACEGVSKCRWVAEIGTKSSPLDSTKLKYFEEHVGEAPNIELTQVVEGKYDPGETAKVTPDVLAADPDVDVYTFESDTNAVAAIPAVEAAGLQGQVKLIGDGGSRAGVKAIAAGKMYGSVAAFPLTNGEVVAKMAIEALEGKAIAEPGVSMFSLGGPIDLTKANVSRYTSQWGAE
ncbi:MAG: sugar ABC transporter substrate-binding protein [Solirubrobacterales bacterium]